MLFDLNNSLDQEKAKVYFDRLIIQNKKIELKAIQMNRTVTNNAYMHVCISIYAIYVGLTIEEAKTDLKRLCSFMVYAKKGVKYLKLTRNLNDKEVCDFTEWIRNHSSKQGCYIPDPYEYKANRINIDKEINKHKTYL